MTKLKVKIPIKFKEALDFRFNPQNAKKTENYFVIRKSCPLCKTFIGCINCPFDQFTKSYTGGHLIGGCFAWLDKVIEDRLFTIVGSGVSWRIRSNELARKQLLELRDKAQKLITWEEAK